MKPVIKHIAHPYPSALLMARRDHAKITGQPLMERPWWFEDLETGYLYHDLYACIGWPSEVSDKDVGQPGYAAIVGVIRPKTAPKDQYYEPRDAKFLLLCEAESFDIHTLLRECLHMREKYGFGLQPDLLTAWYGDPERFALPVALFNERMPDETKAILITPPDDFYVPKIFDNYVRSLQSTLIKGKQRFWFGTCTILKTRIKEFMRDDPAVLAAGGLVHSLLARTMWMDQSDSMAFSVEEAV